MSEYITQKIERKLKGEKEPPAATACVAVTFGNHLLMGKRRDSGNWTCPGGHLNVGEPAILGCLRELYEETGILAGSASYLGYGEVEGKRIHCFEIALSRLPETTTKNDPDKEVSEWHWFDVSKGLPDMVKNHLQHPKNILLKKVSLL